ncbi:MAG: gliding motility-associated C-terminal domain-containing protein [Bacteroidetes bacterium]|nr:MAG: gliding motility-associated C-terminal domain-containing protein [Bacteroidota bacterium]
MQIHLIYKNPIIYTAFTPNTSDNLNSTWIIDRLNLYPNNKVTIQDKWGNIVYQQSNYHLTPWDGTYNGKNAPEGMYYFVLELNQQNKPITGTINIIR